MSEKEKPGVTKVVKDSQMVLLIVGLAMTVSFGGLIISSALR